MADLTLRSKYQRLSILKYVHETIGEEGGAGFVIVTNSRQVDFEALRETRGGWVVFEMGMGDLGNKMGIAVLITCCARAADSEDQLDTMKDSVRDAFAQGSIFSHYNTETHTKLGGFIVQDCLEGPSVEQVTGGFDVTFTVLLKVGVVI
jgi:hypothetical protein